MIITCKFKSKFKCKFITLAQVDNWIITGSIDINLRILECCHVT